MSRICARAHKQIPIQFSSDQFSRFRSDTPNLRLQKEKNCCTCNMAPRSFHGLRFMALSLNQDNNKKYLKIESVLWSRCSDQQIAVISSLYCLGILWSNVGFWVVKSGDTYKHMVSWKCPPNWYNHRTRKRKTENPELFFVFAVRTCSARERVLFVEL